MGDYKKIGMASHVRLLLLDDPLLVHYALDKGQGMTVTLRH